MENNLGNEGGQPGKDVLVAGLSQYPPGLYMSILYFGKWNSETHSGIAHMPKTYGGPMGGKKKKLSREIILEYILDRCTREELELYAEIIKRIWLRRNVVVHGGEFSHPNKLIQEATLFLKVCMDANAKE